MTVTFYQLRDDEVEYDEVATVENGEIVTGEEALPPLHPDELADEQRLIEHYDGPYLVAADESDTPTDTAKTHWLTEPRLGKVGWYNEQTGAFQYNGSESVVSRFLDDGDTSGLQTMKTSLVACEADSTNLLKQDDDKWIPYKGPQGGEGWQQVGSGEVRYQQHPPGEVAEGHDADYWKQRWPEIEGSEWDEAVPSPIDMKEDDALLFVNRDNQTEVGRFESATFIRNEDWDSAKTGVVLQDGREVLTDNIEAHADMTLAVEPPTLHGDSEWGDAPAVYSDYNQGNLIYFENEDGKEKVGIIEGFTPQQNALKVETNEKFEIVPPPVITHYAETDASDTEAYNVIESSFDDAPDVRDVPYPPSEDWASQHGATVNDVRGAFRKIFGGHLVNHLNDEIESGKYDPDDPDDILQAIVSYRGDDKDDIWPTLKHEIRGRANGMGGDRVERIIDEAFATETSDPIYAVRQRIGDADANTDNPEAWLEHAAQWAYEDDWVSLPALQDAIDDWAGEIPLRVRGIHGFDGEPEEIVALSETGTNSGISAGAMFIAEWEDGNRAYITRTRDEHEHGHVVSHHMESSVEAERAMTGFGVQSALAEDNDKIQVPDHEYRHDAYFSVKAAPQDAIRAEEYERDTAETPVDRDDFMNMALGAILAGNKDLHHNNVMVDDDGTLYPIDLDFAGYDMTEGEHLSRAIGQLVSTAKELDIEVNDEFEDSGDPSAFDDAKTPLGQEILAHVNDASSKVTETARDGNPMWGARNMGDNIARNAEGAKNGELEL